MNQLHWSSIIFYCLAGIFVFYQQLHVKNFRGASQSLALILNISAFAGMLTCLIYLIYYGWAVVWWAPFAIFFIGLIASMMGLLLEKVVGASLLSMIGLIGWPVSAYFMFKQIPVA